MESKRENGKEIVREWGNEKMDRKWGNGERGRNGERDFLPLHVFFFSPLHLQFPILSPFSLSCDVFLK